MEGNCTVNRHVKTSQLRASSQVVWEAARLSAHLSVTAATSSAVMPYLGPYLSRMAAASTLLSLRRSALGEQNVAGSDSVCGELMEFAALQACHRMILCFDKHMPRGMQVTGVQCSGMVPMYAACITWQHSALAGGYFKSWVIPYYNTSPASEPVILAAPSSPAPGLLVSAGRGASKRRTYANPWPRPARPNKGMSRVNDYGSCCGCDCETVIRNWRNSGLQACST